MSEWQPIETAPHDTRVLVFVDDKTTRTRGVQMGRIFHYRDRAKPYSRATAEGFNGDWDIKLWQPLPSPPPLSGEGGK